MVEGDIQSVGRRAEPGEHAGLPPLPRRAAWVDWARRWGGPLAVLGVFALALFALQRIVEEFAWWEVVAAIRAIPNRAIVISLLLTAASYLALTGYDFCALSYIGRRLKPLTVLFAAFTGYAVGNSVGFAVVSGGSVRYRIYTAAGLSPLDVGRIVAFTNLTFTIGISLIGTVALAMSPGMTAEFLGWRPTIVVAIGIAVALLLAGFLLFAAVGPRRIRVGRWLVDTPSVTLVLFQILLSTLEIGLAGAALYALLPAEIGVDLFGFLVIFAAAMIAGILSHVPGGIGVFDSIVIFALADHVDPASTAGALVLYRFIYYLLPLTLAALLFGGSEMSGALRSTPRAARRVTRTASGTAPTVLAVMTFTVGLFLVLSGATPPVFRQLHLLRGLLPLGLVEVAQILASLAGMALLVLSRGMIQRLDAAWLAATVALGVGTFTSVAKGANLVEMAIAVAALVILVASRKEFYRRSRLADLHLPPGWFVAVIGAGVGSIWLTFFVYQHLEEPADLLWRFALQADAPRSLRAAAVVAAAVVVLALWQVLRPARLRTEAPTEADLARVGAVLARVPSLEGHLAFLRDKALLFSAADDGFLMYGQRGSCRIALGDPVGPPAAQRELVSRFREESARAAVRPAFYQVGDDRLPLYVEAGLSPVKIGEAAAVPLADFSLDGSERREVRLAVDRATRDGLGFEILPPDGPPQLMDELRLVSDAWLAAGEAAEKRFSLSFFDPGYLARCPVAVVREDERITAFANLWLGPPGTVASLDMMRHRPGCHEETATFLVARLLLWAQEQGYDWFDLGMAPLSGLDAHPLAPVWHRVGSLLFQGGGLLHDFEALRRSKERFHPQWHARYLACGGGLTPAEALINVAILVNRGLLPHRLRHWRKGEGD